MGLKSFVLLLKVLTATEGSLWFTLSVTFRIFIYKSYIRLSIGLFLGHDILDSTGIKISRFCNIYDETFEHKQYESPTII